MPKGIYLRQSLEERFWSKVNVKPESECWEYIGHINKYGYGQIKVSGKNEYAHRIAWVLTHGKITEGMNICHKCDNRPCCNPLHLFEGTYKDNNADRKQKGRSSDRKGKNNGRSVLTEEDVLKIRELHESGVRQCEIAKSYNVGFTSINDVIHKKRWLHL